jgi:hypothetical protein
MLRSRRLPLVWKNCAKTLQMPGFPVPGGQHMLADTDLPANSPFPGISGDSSHLVRRREAPALTRLARPWYRPTSAGLNLPTYDRPMRQLTSLDAQFLAFGVVADRDQTPDLWSMLDRLRDSLEELK